MSEVFLLSPHCTWRDADWPPEPHHRDVVLQRVLVEGWVDGDGLHLPPDGCPGPGPPVVAQQDVHHGEEAGLHPRQAVGGRDQVPVRHQTSAAEYVAP